MKRHILVVDDDVAIQDLVKFHLEQAGFVVKVCKDGFGALDELNNNHYDLILLDISMPHMNGFTTLTNLRARPDGKFIPVLMLTGSTEKNDIIKAKKFDIADYIVKPPQREDLLQRVERVLGGVPQYEEIKFAADDINASGQMLLDFRIKSMSNNGIIFEGEVPLAKGYQINLSKQKILEHLKLDKKPFKVNDCTQNDDGKFDYFVTFNGMTKEDQERLRDWVMTQVFKQRAG